MIGHEARRQNWQVYEFLGLRHEIDECRVVDGLMKDICPSIRSIENVIALAGEDLAWRAGHLVKIAPDTAARMR
jgi:hypothetical protein